MWLNATMPFTLHRGGGAMGSASAKEKVVADGPPSPPLGSLTETTVGVGFNTSSAEDWTRFTELGLLDESVMQRKDHETLIEKVSKLKREIFD
ncbi:protein CROWDED NUCLEI 2-like [Vigna radiata var. radiata]|uniref:Protein CROWDED NUCLEI 2-like n=1 Tax=Vigna radiata var. radiata TaxID=3916 RepID=A0A3Q0FF63_VIGRR|nr:protein CROWDED NUCLEI 2-like [Vigna radiata var. radiata]